MAADGMVPEVLKTAWCEEATARRRFWIAGVPTAADLSAVTKQVAGRFKVPVEAVENALSKEA